MKNIFLCLTKANATLKTGGGDSQIFKHFWQYAACLLLAFVLGIGQMWGGTITWNTADNSGNSDVSLSNNYAITGDDASTTLTYANPNGCKRLKKSGGLYMNGASGYNNNKNERHLTFKAPSSAGTVSITFAAIAGKTDGSSSQTAEVKIYGGTTVAYTVTTLNTSLTSPTIYGLKKGTSDIIITFSAKCTITEVKWTDADSPSYTTVYANDFTASPMGVATVSYSNMSAIASAVTSWSGWDNTYAKGYASSSSSCSATLTFATPLELNSNGTDCGRIRVYWGHSTKNKSLGLKVNGSSVTFDPASVSTTIYPTVLNVAEYTIPKTTTTISSIQPSGSSSTITYLFRIEVLTHASGGSGGGCTNVDIGTQPTSPVAATVGSACSITGLVASGTNPTYQWQTCNSDGTGATNISAAGAMSFSGYNTATLGLTPTAEGTTYYKCVVSGDCGDPVTSNVVTVTASPVYSITYAGYGNSSGSMTNATNIASGSDKDLAANAFVKTDNVFVGWKTNVALTYVPYGKADEEGNRINAAVNDIIPDQSKIKGVSADITLTAQWAVPLVTYTMAVDNSSFGAGTSSTSDETNITARTGLTDVGSVGTPGSNSGKGNRTCKINVLSNDDKTAGEKYLTVDFTVASGKQVAIDHVDVLVSNVSKACTFDVEVSDVNGTSISTTGESFTGTSEQIYTVVVPNPSDKKFSGKVTIKITPYKGSGSATEVRLGKYIYVFGEVEMIPVSGYAITKSAVTNGTIAVTDGADAISSADEDDVVYIAATPNTGYGFTSWSVFKTGDTETTVTLAADDDEDNKTRKFSMPAYDVTVGATFTAINYTVTHSAAINGSYTIKVGDASAVSTDATANYGQTVTLAASPNPGYGFSGWTVMQGETPVSVTNNTFTMPAGNVTVSATFALEPNVYYYKNASRYDGETYKNPEGNDAGSDDNTALTTPWTICNACVTGVTKVEATAARYDGKGTHMNAYIKLRQKDNGKIVFTIDDDYKATIKIKMGGYDGANTNITMKLNDSGDNIAYSGTMGGAGTTENGYAELTYANLAAGAYTLKPTSGSLYISQIDIQTTPIYTVTHTLTGATTSSATKVSAGEEYSATYTAETGYSLPASIMVKVGGSTIDAENYTWNQSTGALTIPAAQVTGNIQVIVVGDFTCPEAASGDVVFSWTPKASLDNADIAAGTYNLPGEWLESVYGGSAQIYVNSDEAMRIRNNQLAFNGNNAYVHLTICALAEGDRILVNSSNETNARNLWISLNTTRPDDAEAAAAVIEQGKAYYISSTSPLKGATDLYIWRVSNTTQVGEISIIRSKKFTVTYAASDLTGGEVPAAVTDIFDGQTITVAGKGTMEKGTMLFNGWKDANEVSYAAGVDLEVTTNMTLTAQWSQLYSVTYAKAGTEEGTVPTQESLLNGAQFTVADQGSLVTPANKVFGGWNDGTQTYEAGETYTIDGADVTLTAVWNNSYTVLYDANGGEGTMADGTGTTVSIAANDFTYADHKFLRWNSQPDGEGTNYAVGAEVSENLTLYAIWKEVTCTAGTNIFSIAFTNTANVNMADGDDDKDMSSYATIVGGSALMSYFRSGKNDNVLTYGSSTSKASFGTNSQYLQLNLDCALQAGDVITIVDESGNKTAIASELTDDKIPLNGTKENTSSTNTYTVLENDNIENADVLYIGRNTSSGTLTFTAITIYRPLPDASVPTINNATPADAEYTGAASPMTVSADAEGAKDLHYQWYKEAGETDIEVGEDAASYTPIASGEYYCVVTNSPTGYAPQSATSRTATITMISSDATLAWLKADGNDIALSEGVYAYEYVIADAATVAPTITAGKNEEHAEVTITQADSKTGTATIHVVAQDGSTSHDYTVKFNEFSGCLTAFYFPYATDADNNHVTNNAQLRGHTVFTNVQSDGSGNGGTLTVNEVDYTVTRSTSSISSFGKLVVPEKYTATLYLLVKIGSANTSLQLVKDGESTPYMSSDVYAETGTYQYNFENIQAGTYVIRAWRNGNVQNCNYLAMAAELCRYEVSSVSLANMNLRTGNTATPEMTITPAKGAVVSQAWSFVDAATAEAAGLSINATTGAVTATDAATPGNYTVKVVLNGNNALSATCTVTVLTEYSQVNVTGTTEWDFATGKAASARIDIGYGDKLLANVDGVTNDETFNSQALMVDANYVSNSQLQSKSVMFHATVPGLLIIRYACTSGKDADRVLYINDRETTSKTKTTSVIEYTQVVPAGDVTIKAMFGETPEVDIMNYKYIKFTAASELDPTKAEESTLGGYERTVNPQYYGTVCLPKAGVMVGATVFEIAYMDYKEDGVTPYKVYYDQVENGTMAKGMPYIFLAEQSTIGVYYTGTAEETAKDHNGLHGTLTDINSGMNATGIYMLYNNQVVHSTNAASTLPANRAYLQISEIPGYGNPSYVAPAPKNRRISTGFNGVNTTTGMDEIEASETPMKVMIEGQIYIIRGEKMYDVTGKLVK